MFANPIFGVKRSYRDIKDIKGVTITSSDVRATQLISLFPSYLIDELLDFLRSSSSNIQHSYDGNAWTLLSATIVSQGHPFCVTISIIEYLGLNTMKEQGHVAKVQAGITDLSRR